ncbi:MAG: ATP synthase subunit I [Lachnospirales bacterium]
MESASVLKQIVKTVIALGIIALGIGLFFTSESLYWVFGIVLGTAISVFKVIMLEKTLNKAVDMSPEDAKNYTRTRYTYRLVLSILAVVVCIKIPFINVIGVIVGLLLVQPAVYIVNFFSKKNK